MLTAAVEAGHNHGNTVCTACNRLDQALQICKMIIGRHIVLMAEQVIGQAIVTGVNNQKNVMTADGLLYKALCVTALETGAITANNKGISLNTHFLTPVDQMLVNQMCKFLSTGACNQHKGCFLSGGVEEFCGCNKILRHDTISPPLL